MPIISSIRTSIENKESLVLDKHAKLGTFCRDSRNRLIAHTGGFTIVFPYVLNGEKWAFRCWHAEMGNVRRRFEIISKAIQSANAEYLCDFTYTDEGIVVDGKIYPTTRMRWVDGVTIKDFICSNKSNRTVLEALANNFLSLVQDMHRRGFAHGDLQHGNIIVDKSGKLFLVDYDSFYCKELQGESDIITGLKDYQHPLRCHNTIASDKLDYFSELIIYLSILGIAVKPQLVDMFQVADADHLLFEASDYVDIRQSKIYQELSGLSFEIDLLLQILELYLSQTSLDELMPFDVLLEQLNKTPEIIAFSASCGTECIQGDTVSFYWKVQNYTKILLNGEDFTALTSTTMRVESSSTFSLEVHNGIKKTSQALSIRAYGKPHIALTANKVLLHQNKSEQVVLNWGVQNALNISLLQDGHTIVENCNADDSFSFMSGATSTSFTIRVVGLDRNLVQTKTLDITVCPDAVIHFTTDKEYVFPTIPFTLHWDTQFAKEVQLNGKKVNANGELCVSDGVETNTTYTLSVMDDFGIKEQSITIKMLPIPRIESLIIPTPNIEKNLNFTVNIPTPIVALDIPIVDIRAKDLIPCEMYNLNVETNAVQQPTEIKLDCTLPEPTLWNRISKTISKILNK